MSNRSLRHLLGGLLAATLPLSGCTADTEPTPGRGTGAPAPALRLVAFDSCQSLLTDLRRAARDAVGPYGFPGADQRAEVIAGGARRLGVEDAVPATGAAPAEEYSGTNTHERGADEPDVVKTDGRRIVTVVDGALRVVDATTRKQTARLDLDIAPGVQQPDLLLAGDTVLVLVTHAVPAGARIEAKPASVPQPGPELLQVTLAGKPRVVSRYRLDAGTVVDARQTGGVARVVLRSTPRITLPTMPGGGSDEQRIRANRAAVEAAPVEAWLPGYEIVTGGRSVGGRVGCDRVSRPAGYSGTSLVTVLTFDLAAAALSDGDPIAVVADGDTVYGTGAALYVATDQRWRGAGWRASAGPADPGRTEIYRFTTAGKARPVYTAAGSVPGRLLNQYAMSEWEGHLRVATTSDDGSSAGFAEQTVPATSSAVRVLRADGGSLVETGVVDGLGKGERIYAVRFVGPRGYVVTFRQTDPLYTVDLGNPAAPAVTGELKITGYSAHLQPAGDGRLLGIGQEATAAGATTGTQISLFDVADPRAPRRVAAQHIADGQSEAEHDPHAVLWWPASNLLVVPVTVYAPQAGTEPRSSAVAIRVTPTGLTRVGAVAHQSIDGVPPTIRRTMMVGGTLWTLSDAGLQANDAASLARVGWVPTT